MTRKSSALQEESAMQSVGVRTEAETNAELMQQFYGGEATAFDKLAERLRSSLLCQALQQLPARHSGRHQLAEDLLQQAMIKAVSTLERPEIRWQAGKGGVRTWLGTILRNLVTSYLRSPASRQWVMTDFTVARDETSSGRLENQIVDHRINGQRTKARTEHRRQWLICQVDCLPKKIKAIVSQKLEGRTHQQIAESLGISKSTVTYHFNSAKRILRSMADTAA